MLKKAVRQGRSERRCKEVQTALRVGRSPLKNGSWRMEEPPTVLPTSQELHNVELLSDARTKLAGFFSVQLGDYAQFPTDCGKGGAGSHKLFVRVGCRHLDANSSLAFRHNRVTEPYDIDPFLQQPIGHSGGE
jgi:hypothetical protein